MIACKLFSSTTLILVLPEQRQGRYKHIQVGTFRLITLTRRRVVLQQTKQLYLQPRNWHLTTPLLSHLLGEGVPYGLLSPCNTRSQQESLFRRSTAESNSSGIRRRPRKTAMQNTHMTQPVDRLLITGGERIQMVLRDSHDQGGGCETYTLHNSVGASVRRNRGGQRSSQSQLTGSLSSMILTIRSAHSVTGSTVGCLRYRRSNVKAAFS